jgi:DNA-directed RNA polymerase subunit M/transcription elongation factor TFIIS
MKLEFCPQCAGIDITKDIRGLSRCKRCGFQGEMRYGAMNEINALRKSLKASEEQQMQAPMLARQEAKKEYDNPLKEKLKGLKGKKTSEADFL